MEERNNSWRRHLSEDSRPYTDMSLPPWAFNVELVASGAAMLVGAVFLGPEMLAGEAAYEAYSSGSTIASAIMSGTANIVIGSVGLGSGQDMHEASAAAGDADKPSETVFTTVFPGTKPILESFDRLSDYVGLLKDDGLEDLSKLAEALAEMDTMGEDLNKLTETTDPALSGSSDPTDPSQPSSSQDQGNAPSLPVIPLP